MEVSSTEEARGGGRVPIQAPITCVYILVALCLQLAYSKLLHMLGTEH